MREAAPKTLPNRARHWCNVFSSRYSLTAPFPFPVRYHVVANGTLEFDKNEYEIKHSGQKKNHTQPPTEIDALFAAAVAAFSASDMQTLPEVQDMIEEHKVEFKKLAQQLDVPNTQLDDLIDKIVDQEGKLTAKLEELKDEQGENGETARRMLAIAKEHTPAAKLKAEIDRRKNEKNLSAEVLTSAVKNPEWVKASRAATAGLAEAAGPSGASGSGAASSRGDTNTKGKQQQSQEKGKPTETIPPATGTHP